MSGTIGSARTNPCQTSLVIVGDLLDGKSHDRQSVAERVGVKTAAADRIIARLKNLPRIECRRVRRRQTIQLSEKATGEASLPKRILVAGCIGGCLASLFAGTNYQPGIRDAVGYLLGTRKKLDSFKDIDRKFFFVHRGGEVSLPDKAGELDEIVDAILNCEWLAMRYQDFDGQVTHPRVQPLSLVIYDHQIYLFARYAGGNVRALRFARISNTRRLEKRFDYPPRTEYDPDQVCRDGFGIFIDGGAPVAVEVRLDGRWAVYAKTHRWHPSQQIEWRGDHVIVRLRLRICPELEGWILSFGRDAEVLAPADLRTRIAGHLRAASARYESAAS